MPYDFEISFIETAAIFFQQHEMLAKATVIFVETNFSKALPFAPFLIVAWYSNKGASRQKVIATCISCAIALVVAWCFTSTWIRPRPVSPQSGIEIANQVLSPYFENNPNYIRWGCFPSDQFTKACFGVLVMATPHLQFHYLVDLCFA